MTLTQILCVQKEANGLYGLSLKAVHSGLLQWRITIYDMAHYRGDASLMSIYCGLTVQIAKLFDRVLPRWLPSASADSTSLMLSINTGNSLRRARSMLKKERAFSCCTPATPPVCGNIKNMPPMEYLLLHRCVLGYHSCGF